MKPLISVIITTKNEENNIRDCLKAIQEQNYPQENTEVLVVDNNSIDSTNEVVEKFIKNNPSLNARLFNQGPERSAQRNFGAQKSKGEFIIFLDADMTLNKNVLAECLDKIKKNSNLVALYIPEVILGKGFFSKARNFERSFYNQTVIDGLRFMRKDKFIGAGMFDENLYACEDWDLDKRLKKLGAVDIVNSPLYHNEAKFELKKYLSKKAYYGENVRVYVNKWGKDDLDVKKQFGFFYRYVGVFAEKGKWKKLLAHPILTLGMYWLRFRVGLVFMKQKV